MLYAISWEDTYYGTYQVIGTRESVFQLANILESKKILFSVSNTLGYKENQHQLGYGGFAYWKAA